MRSLLSTSWGGKLTSSANIVFLIPAWAWFASVVLVEVQHLSQNFLLATFFPVFALSMLPFFRRKIGLLRLGIFGWLLPAIATAVVIGVIKSFTYPL